MGILDSIGTFLGDEENRLNLASGFAGMSGNPNAGNIQQGYQNRLTALRGDRKLEGAKKLEAEKLKRHTASALQLLGNEFPEISKALLGGFLTPKEAVNEMRNPDKGTSSMQEYALAKEQGFAGTFKEYQTAIKKAGANSIAVSVGGTDAKPQKGATNYKDPITGFTTEVPISGGIIDTNAQKEIEIGNSSIQVINDALSHAGLSGAVGSIDSKFKSFLPDTVAFEAYHDQIKGKTFLAAFQSLKGGGPITDVEGAKAEQATARLDLAQDENDYKKALIELRDVVQGVIERNQRILDRIPTGSQAPNNDPLGIL